MRTYARTYVYIHVDRDATGCAFAALVCSVAKEEGGEEGRLDAWHLVGSIVARPPVLPGMKKRRVFSRVFAESDVIRSGCRLAQRVRI